jgi:arylsulfatase A-like enzyme
MLGAWFALLAGIGDLVLYLVTSVLMHRYAHLSPQIVWLSPVSNLLLFVIPAVILWALARWRPAHYWPFVTATVFAFLAVWGLTLYATRLHRVAAVVLTLGIAIQTARILTANPKRARKVVLVTLPAMAAIALIGGLGLNAWYRLTETRALAQLPPAAAGSPNILLLILDTVRAESLSLYGYPRRTSPSIDQFAKSGVTFDAAISASPWTLPSHATMFTGRWPHELNANWRTPLDATWPTLAEVLSENGYATAAFVANRFYASRQSGLARGFQHYDDTRYSPGRLLLASALGRFLVDRTPMKRWFGQYDDVGRKRARSVNEELLDWMSHRDGKARPFFVFLNYFDAHDPYIAPAPFNTLFDRQTFPLHPGMTADSVLTFADIQSEVAAYDESVAALDHQVGLLLAELERRGALRNTIVVITSDHGEELGEHGFLRHGKTLYMQELHVPLVISFPRRLPQGLRVNKPVTLRDVAATVIDLAAVPNQSATAAPALSGRSLARFWTSSEAHSNTRDTLISEVRYRANRSPREPTSKGDMASIVDSATHLIRGGDGAIELYQIDVDPGEKVNVAARPEAQDRIQRLSATLGALIPMKVRR